MRVLRIAAASVIWLQPAASPAHALELGLELRDRSSAVSAARIELLKEREQLADTASVGLAFFASVKETLAIASVLQDAS